MPLHLAVGYGGGPRCPMPSMCHYHASDADQVVRSLLKQCKLDVHFRDALRKDIQECIDAMFGRKAVWFFTHAYMNGTAVPDDVARVTVGQTPLVCEALPPNVTQLVQQQTDKRTPQAAAYKLVSNGVTVVLSVKTNLQELPSMRMSCKTRAAICCAKHLMYRDSGIERHSLAPMWRMVELLGQNYFYSSVNRALLDFEMQGFLDFLQTLDFASHCYTGFGVHHRDPQMCIGKPQMSSSDVLCKIIIEGSARGIVLDDFDDYKNVYPAEIDPKRVQTLFATIYGKFQALVDAKTDETDPTNNGEQRHTEDIAADMFRKVSEARSMPPFPSGHMELDQQRADDSVASFASHMG